MLPADEIVNNLTELTGGTYRFFGGGALDDARFTSTCVFFDTEVVPDAIVMPGLLSNKIIGTGVNHSLQSGSGSYRGSDMNESIWVSLYAMPGIESICRLCKNT